MAKKFDETKLLTDGFKLAKAMHDIFVCLSKQAHFGEMKVRQLRIAGMLHMVNKIRILQFLVICRNKLTDLI